MGDQGLGRDPGGFWQKIIAPDNLCERTRCKPDQGWEQFPLRIWKFDNSDTCFWYFKSVYLHQISYPKWVNLLL